MTGIIAWLFGRRGEAPTCPYCHQDRSRQSCIDEWMAKQVLPTCAAGPRDDASAKEKEQFHAWMAKQASAEVKG